MDKFHVALTKELILSNARLINLLGQVVFEEQGSQLQNLSILVRNLTSGIYFLEVTVTDAAIIRERVLVSRLSNYD